MPFDMDKYIMERFWPAQRARNFVKKLKLHTGRPLTREENFKLLAKKINVIPDDIKTMSPIQFCRQILYIKEQRERGAVIGDRQWEIDHDADNYASTVMGKALTWQVMRDEHSYKFYKNNHFK